MKEISSGRKKPKEAADPRQPTEPRDQTQPIEPIEPIEPGDQPRDQPSDQKPPENPDRDLGAIFWTAPEVLANPDACDTFSDCYSFGIILWEIFHRTDPYPGKDPMAVAFEVMNKFARPAMSPARCIEDMRITNPNCGDASAKQLLRYTSRETFGKKAVLLLILYAAIV